LYYVRQQECIFFTECIICKVKCVNITTGLIWPSMVASDRLVNVAVNIQAPLNDGEFLD